MTETELWQCIYRAFEAHRRAGELNAQTALNRIAAKCIARREGAPVTRSFDPSTSRAREEYLSPGELRRLESFHERASPLRDVEPIVVLVYEGRHIVIDGNNRVNKWRHEKASRPRRAIVIEPK